MTRRSGFTLTELIVAMAVLAIMGTALARLLLNNSRFIARQEAMLEARQVARAAMNVASAELRMVTDGGVVAAAPDSLTVRMPYRFGMLCLDHPDGWTASSVLPVDSVVDAESPADGIAWRQPGGTYAFAAGVAVADDSPFPNICDVDSIRIVPGGERLRVQGYFAPPGTIYYQYRLVTYRFGPSTALPGRRALWRRIGAAAATEIASPFADSAGFQFLVDQALTPRPTPPATMDSLLGVELRLISESIAVPPDAPAPLQFDLRQRVRFANRAEVP